MKDKDFPPIPQKDRSAFARIARMIQAATDAEDAVPLDIARCREAIRREKPLSEAELNLLDRSLVSQKNMDVAKRQEVAQINAALMAFDVSLEAAKLAASTPLAIDDRTHGSIETTSFRLYAQYDEQIADAGAWVLTFEAKDILMNCLASRMVSLMVRDSTGRVWLDRELDARGCASDFWRYDDSPIERLSKLKISVIIH